MHDVVASGLPPTRAIDAVWRRQQAVAQIWRFAPSHPLSPAFWKQSHPEAIRIYRQEERRSRANAKAVKRARRRIARKG